MNTRRRFIAIMLALVVCLPGCGVPGPIGGLDYISYNQSEDGIVINPTRLTLRVNEARRIDAILEGPITQFVRYGWTVSSSSIVLVPGACSDGGGGIRVCGAEITAAATGTATITFTATRQVSSGTALVRTVTPDGDLLDREAALQVSVIP